MHHLFRRKARLAFVAGRIACVLSVLCVICLLMTTSPRAQTDDSVEPPPAADSIPDAEQGDDATEDEAPAVPAYEVVITGVDEDLEELLRALSQTEAKAGEPTPFEGILQRRLSEDVKRFKTALTSQGFFEAAVDAAYDAEAQPPVARFTVEPGPVFTLTGMEYALPEAPAEGEDTSEPPLDLPDAQALELPVGEPFRAKPVKAARSEIETALANAGRPFPEVSEPRVLADFEAKTARVVYTVTPGPLADFGETTIEGLTSVEEGFVRAYMPWRPGQRYDQSLLEVYYERLSQLNLFATIRIDPEQTLDEADRAPIKVILTERKHRTVRAGVGYSSDKGPEIRGGWAHRNILGAGERFEIKTRLSEVESDLTLTYTDPRFLRTNNAFTAKALYENDDTEAYAAETITTELFLQRQLMAHLNVGAGVTFRHADIKEDEARPFDSGRQFDYLSLPLRATWDSRDNALDPTTGAKIDFRLEPFYSVTDAAQDARAFAQVELAAAAYLALTDSPRVVLAGRVAAGSTIGATREDLPAVLRFYPGGGGSVRGYAYQLAGPLRGNTPLGGASFVTVSAEARIRITETIGVVPFIDGGYAENDAVPLPEDLLFGAGLGLRYYTPIGPFRVDVAVPLRRRADVDDLFEFYISVGQAF